MKNLKFCFSFLLITLNIQVNSIELNQNVLINDFKFTYESTVIDLYNNNISKIDPNTFQGFTYLQYLYLDNNQLEKLDKDLFKNLTNLKEIWLESNKIFLIDKNSFNGLNNLEQICIYGNPIANIYPQIENSFCGNNQHCKVSATQRCTKKYEVEFRYVGCYNDDENKRDLEGLVLKDDKLNHETCSIYCRFNGFIYMGLQNGNECYCGNIYGKYHMSNLDTDCNINCPGNKREKCGSILKNSIYQIKLTNETNQIVTSYPCSSRSDPGYDFKRKGAFTVQFSMKPLPSNTTSIELKIGEFKILLTNKKDNFISIVNEDFDLDAIALDEFRPPETSLLHFNSSENILWVSVYSLDRNVFEENFIKIGIGYQMENNLLVKFVAKSKKGVEMLRAATNVEIDRRIQINEEVCFVNPFLKDYSYLIYDSHFNQQLTFEDLNDNILTSYDLPIEGLRLYDRIKNIQIEQELLDAIDFSIDNNGCSLNKLLKDKAMASFGSSDPRTSYIRVPVGVNFGNQPGQPFVIEIWPKGHYSPVHNHGNTVAIIKMLSGSLISEWYNQLAETYNEIPRVIKRGYLKAGDITWMTPNYYQTHKLINLNSTRAAVSIQAYSYVSSEVEFSESFNYVLPGDGELHRFYPTSDFTIDELKKIVISEFRNQKCGKF